MVDRSEIIFVTAGKFFHLFSSREWVPSWKGSATPVGGRSYSVKGNVHAPGCARKHS